MILPIQASASSPPFQKVSDEALVESVKAGDIDSFGELYLRYSAQLCTYMARLVGNDDLGRDLTQEAFSRAFQSLPSLKALDGKIYFKSWLYRIAIHLAKDHWRREKLIRFLPWKELNEATRDEAMYVESPEQQVTEADMVQVALGRVSPKCRPCLLLDIVEGMTQREIATLLGIGERSVRRYIYQGKEELKEAYQRLLDEVDSTTKRRSVE